MTFEDVANSAWHEMNAGKHNGGSPFVTIARNKRQAECNCGRENPF